MNLGIIHVVGLGAGSIAAMPYGTVQLLDAGHPVYLRTERHPVIDFLRTRQIAFTALDSFYEQSETFSEVYQSIVQYLFQAADMSGEIIYAVPGHPGVAERTVVLLTQAAPALGHEVRFGPGQSFLDDMWLRLGVDPIEGFTLLDAGDLDKHAWSARHHLVVVQMYNEVKASDAKLALSEVYGDDYEVVVARAVGVPGEERIVRVRLYELDRLDIIDHLTTLYVPPVKEEGQLLGEWGELLAIIARLRSPEGCPWDMEQTHDSLRPFVIEEAYEVVHAIDEGDLDALSEELGDLLLQVVLHSQIGHEEGYFTARDVIRTLCEKLIRRHPHVFSDVTVRDADEVMRNWKAIKVGEKREQGETVTEHSLLDEVHVGMPPFVESRKLQSRTAKVGFDWPDVEDVYAKVQEELDELHAAADPKAQREELGDLLFVLTNLARWLDIDPDEALRGANRKFRMRFLSVEKQLRARSLSFSSATLDILEEFWQNAKVKAE